MSHHEKLKRIIDERRIEEAAFDFNDGELTNDKLIREAFIYSAKWMQEEFLKNLWHPASEEPDVRNKTIICLYENGDIRQDYDVYDEATRHDRILGIGKFNWNYYAENEEIMKWCYETDLFPKEGGEKNERI